MANLNPESFLRLAAGMEGEVHADKLLRTIYSTDASAYQELPQAVAIPKSEGDLVELIRFASANGIGLLIGNSIVLIGRGVAWDARIC